MSDETTNENELNVEAMHASVITPEDIETAKAYEASLGAEGEEAPAPEAEPEAPEAPAETPADPESLELAEPDEAEAPTDEAAELIDISAYSEEWSSEAGLSDESRQLLVDALGSKFANAEALVDQFIAGAQAQANVMQTAAFDMVGGAQNYAAMQEWARESVTPAQREAFNTAVNTPGMQEMAIRGLYAQFQAATGATPEPQRVGSPANVSGGVEPVTSLEQVAALTADPRFDRDPAFRAEVERRIAAGMRR